MRIFWPFQYAQLKIVVVLDGEAKGIDRLAAIIRSEVENLLPYSTQIIINYNFPAINFGRGWDRQQWIMFWADNFTTSKHVGFVDSDTIFVTRILPKDLFQNGKPVARGLFGKPYDDWWSKVPKTSTKAIGTLEPFNCMTYFPVIFKTSHLKDIRQRIIDQLGPTVNFESANRRLLEYRRGIYSQYNIMYSYLFYFQQDDYRWTLYEMQKRHWQGPFLPTQTGKSDEIKPFLNKTKWRPDISSHWTYEYFRETYERILQTGACFSWPEISDLCDKAKINYKTSK